MAVAARGRAHARCDPGPELRRGRRPGPVRPVPGPAATALGPPQLAVLAARPPPPADGADRRVRRRHAARNVHQLPPAGDDREPRQPGPRGARQDHRRLPASATPGRNLGQQHRQQRPLDDSPISLASLVARRGWGYEMVGVATAVNRRLAASSVAPIFPILTLPASLRDSVLAVQNITVISINHLDRIARDSTRLPSMYRWFSPMWCSARPGGGHGGR